MRIVQLSASQAKNASVEIETQRNSESNPLDSLTNLKLRLQKLTCQGKLFDENLRKNRVDHIRERKFLTSGTISVNKMNKRCIHTDSWTNITPRIQGLLERRGLYKLKHHPLGLINLRIVDFLRKKIPELKLFDDLNPIVTLEQNFDSLLIPPDHVSRKNSESFYYNKESMLRAHTSAHQVDLIRDNKERNFLVVGDVYRRDSVDSTHYPVFHQMEGVRILPNTNPNNIDGRRSEEKQENHSLETKNRLEKELKDTLSALALDLFGSECELRWVSAYFPFTHPSWELEVKFGGEWLEVLGCGIMEQKLLNRAGIDGAGEVGWAFGLGLERLAMKLYGIPDIRLFWSKDPGFLNQFETDDFRRKIAFEPFSKFPSCPFDISFWLPEVGDGSDDALDENDFHALAREVGGDLIESVKLFDRFTHPKKKRTSLAFRVVYRSCDKTLTKEEVNNVHDELVRRAVNELNVTIR